MKQENRKESALVRILGSAALAGIIAIAALMWSVYSSQTQDLAISQQLDNQATEIAIISTQHALNLKRNQLLENQVTLEARKATIEDEQSTLSSTNSTEVNLTATFIASQSSQIEATTQAIILQQQQIEATETAIAQPLSGQSISVPTIPTCPLVVVEGSVGGLPISETKTWAELSEQGTTSEPKSANINHICSRDNDNQVQVWIGYWSQDSSHLHFRRTMTSEEAFTLAQQNPQQPIIVVPWGE